MVHFFTMPRGAEAEQLRPEPPPGAETGDEILVDDSQIEGGEVQPDDKEAGVIQAGLTPEAQKRYGTLPERQKGLFARIREKLPFGRKNPTENVRGAREYYDQQTTAVKEARRSLEEAQKQREALLQEVEAGGQRAVEVSPEEVVARMDALLESAGLSEQERTKALEDARATAEKEYAATKKRQTKVDEQRMALENKIEPMQNRIERFGEKREKARDALDDAVVKAINQGGEQAEALEGLVAQATEQVEKNKAETARLEAALADLTSKLPGLKADSVEAATLKGVIDRAQKQKRALETQNQALIRERAKPERQLKKVEERNERLVPYLSMKRVEELLDDPENDWIVIMLSADQLDKLPPETQGRILKDNAANQKALLPKLAEGQLQKLIDAGIVPDKEALYAQGILEKPAEVKPIEEARAARAAATAKAEASTPETAEEQPKVPTVAEWKEKIREAVAKGGSDTLGVELPEGMDTLDLSTDDILDIGYDQAVAAAKSEAKGDKSKEEGLLTKVLKKFAKFVKELIGFTIDEAEGLVISGLTGKPREKFDTTIERWNKKNPGQKINMQDVPRELHGQDLSPASAKVKLMELMSKQQGGDQTKVREFFEHQTRETPAVAA